MQVNVGLAAIASLFGALAVHFIHHFAPLDVHFPSPCDATVESHFSESYYAARARFRAQANATRAEQFAVPVDVPGYDLTIDFAVLRGNPEAALIHISGTHGVEGFAGSGIQSALLERVQGDRSNEESGPTIVMVHALNPYGFARLRRFNEHNVDLNRNFMTEQEFKKRQEADPNAYGYMEAHDLLNPRSLESIHESFLLRAVSWVLRKGFSGIKRAAVSGNYHYPETIFYGGREQEPSLRALQSFLSDHLDFAMLKAVGVIDVHTGLGPAGYDTIILKSVEQMAVAEQLFNAEKDPNRIVNSGDSSSDVAQGYEGVSGFMCHGFNHFVPSNTTLVCLTQEFGTVPGLFVLKAVVEENAMYHHAPAHRLPYAETLRDVFYVHRSIGWKRSVVDRGLIVFDQLYSHLQREISI